MDGPVPRTRQQALLVASGSFNQNGFHTAYGTQPEVSRGRYCKGSLKENTSDSKFAYKIRNINNKKMLVKVQKLLVQETEL